MDSEGFAAEMLASGLAVSEWADGPFDTYSTHSHPYRKILCCLEGSIVFHLEDRDEILRPGDQLVVEPGVEHSATVGAAGVRCAEAHVP